MTSKGKAADRPVAPLYEACEALFTDYPMAVNEVSGIRAMRSMILMLPGAAPKFFLLAQDGGKRGRPWSLIPWRTRGGKVITTDRYARIPEASARPVTEGIPIPRHGSLFGWAGTGRAITALVAFDTNCRPERPEPSWAAMPLAGTPEAEWPAFTGERVFGRWFWDGCRGGTIVSLADFIGATPGTVFWAETYSTLGSDCCVVSRDAGTREGHTLRAGTYAWARALRASAPGAISEAVAGADLTDLAPAFKGWAQ
jgi:hypothetical protein